MKQWVFHTFALVGMVKCFGIASRLTGFMFRHFVRPLFQSSTRMLDLYGEGQRNKFWAVVTGGSDGIGLAMCKRLAKDGFNICMVARNEEKMQQKLGEIKK